MRSLYVPCLCWSLDFFCLFFFWRSFVIWGLEVGVTFFFATVMDRLWTVVWGLEVRDTFFFDTIMDW